MNERFEEAGEVMPLNTLFLKCLAYTRKDESKMVLKHLVESAFRGLSTLLFILYVTHKLEDEVEPYLQPYFKPLLQKETSEADQWSGGKIFYCRREMMLDILRWNPGSG
jgi:hypothetical protein